MLWLMGAMFAGCCIRSTMAEWLGGIVPLDTPSIPSSNAGDNIGTATAIAQECGILPPAGTSMDEWLRTHWWVPLHSGVAFGVGCAGAALCHRRDQQGGVAANAGARCCIMVLHSGVAFPCGGRGCGIGPVAPARVALLKRRRQGGASFASELHSWSGTTKQRLASFTYITAGAACG